MTTELEKKYDHKVVEQKIYKLWEAGGYFSAKAPTGRDVSKGPYTIILPPPNASGKMHTGNVLMIAIEDLLIRWKRMQGYTAVWIPGTDHAGIETQVTFERKLAEQGKSRLEYDRNTLYQKIWDFVQENKGQIEQQLRDMGASVDWSRYKFTLDDDVLTTVTATFQKMHADGLVYRDEYMVNYCPVCGSTYADVELSHVMQKDPLYYVRYPLVEKKAGEPEFLVVATTRPEPIFVDTHLAVNPADKKNNPLIGRKVLNPLTDAQMEIIGDAFVDPEFGTGIVKLTPAHDKTDYDVAKAHGLPIVTAVDLDGKLTEEAGEFAGLSVLTGRQKIVEVLQTKGLIEKIDTRYEHTVSLCKGKHVIEPMVLPNWFVKTQTLKEPAHTAVKTGAVQIFPAWQEVKYHRWMEEMRDWPISRQVVWGIRIPAWYAVAKNPSLQVTFVKNKEVFTGKISDLLTNHSLADIQNGLQSMIAPKDAHFVISGTTPGADYLQETNTFDTWFSSGQWPLVTTGYPDSEDFRYFYPTAVLETGWEILRLWVSRMIMFGLYLTGEVPFRHVYLHGLVRAIDGRKMSKSLGNEIIPEEYLAEFGADALRMGLISGTATGKDFNFPRDKVIAYRNFANKLWNMARFMLMLSADTKVLEFSAIDPKSLNEKDRELVAGLDELITSTNANLEKYRFADAADAIYHFVWDVLASDYLEHVKTRVDKNVALGVFAHVYKTCLKLLHPFMPFVTEELWGKLEGSEKMLIGESWPEVN